MHTPTIERDYPYAATTPEIELLETIRLAHMPEFSMSVSHQGGVFTIKLTDVVAGKFREAHGATFESAWRVLSVSEFAGMSLDLSERIAARGLKVLDGGIE